MAYVETGRSRGDFKPVLSRLAFILCFLRVAATFDAEGLPIVKFRSPEITDVDRLLFSPGGEHFYKSYLHLHKPVVIQNAAKQWPLLLKWRKKVDDDLLEQHVPVTYRRIDNVIVTSEKLGKVIEEKLEVTTAVGKHSKLLEEVNLPLLLQCEEFVSKLHPLDLHINNLVSEKIQFSWSDEIIVAFDQPLILLKFGINKTLSGESIRLANMAAIDVKTHPHITDVPYQVLELLRGDLVYLPKYSWYHIASPSLVSYTKIKFDYYSFNFDQDIPYVQALEKYKKHIVSHGNTLKCNNTKTSFSHSLNLAIDFHDELMTSHLRIPKKNKRPEDVTLASGYKMPVLGLGTALLNETTYDAVKHALQVGYRLFDLAHAYPHCESGFSKALSESPVAREEVFVVTKLAPRFLGYNETLFAIDQSLERLNTSYIDLYLIHSKECDNFLLLCDEQPKEGAWKQSWRAMEHAMRDGKVRSLGVSNFYRDDIYELLSWSVEPVSVIQNWFDPFNTDKSTRKICSEYNIRYMGYSTLGNYWRFLGLEFNPVFTSSTITGIAANYDYVVASVVLRWAIHENVTVIPRSSNPNHIGKNIRALDLSLLKEEIDLMNGFDEWMSQMSQDDFQGNDISNIPDNLAQPGDKLSMSSDDLTKTNDDLTKSGEDLTKTSDDLSRSRDDLARSRDDLAKSSDDLAKSSDDLAKTSDDLSKTSDDLAKTSEDLSKTSKNTQ